MHLYAPTVPQDSKTCNPSPPPLDGAALYRRAVERRAQTIEEQCARRAADAQDDDAYEVVYHDPARCYMELRPRSMPHQEPYKVTYWHVLTCSCPYATQTISKVNAELVGVGEEPRLVCKHCLLAFNLAADGLGPVARPTVPEFPPVRCLCELGEFGNGCEVCCPDEFPAKTAPTGTGSAPAGTRSSALVAPSALSDPGTCSEEDQCLLGGWEFRCRRCQAKFDEMERVRVMRAGATVTTCRKEDF